MCCARGIVINIMQCMQVHEDASEVSSSIDSDGSHQVIRDMLLHDQDRI